MKSLLMVPQFPPGSEMTLSPTCNTPDSTRPTTLTTFVLDPFEMSVIEIRNGRSRDREGTSIVSEIRLAQQLSAYQDTPVESALCTNPKIFHEVVRLD